MGGNMEGRLYYFSATGNTKFVADRFKEEFNRYGEELELFDIVDEQSIDLKDSRYLIIGTPIHAELPPRMITDFVNKLPEGNSDIKCMVYSTQGANGTAATEYIKRMLVNKGYNVLIQTSFRMANNYYFGAGVERSEEEIQVYCRKVEEKVKHIAEKFFKNEDVKESASGTKVFFSKIASNGFYKFLIKLSANLTSAEECSKCGLCLRNCPKGNITFEDGHAVFHSQCIMCTRCIHVCPINAIRYKGKKINQNQKSLIKYLELK
jgi:ferredoxin